MARLHLEIVTPEKRVYSDDVDGVVLPGSEGELGVLPDHVPLLTTITPGHLQVNRGGQIEHLAVGEGFVEVTGKNVIVLTDMALKDDQINESNVEEALKRAEEALATKPSPEEAAALTASIKKSVAQLHVKRRRHL